jgi:hypothetical protein
METLQLAFRLVMIYGLLTAACAIGGKARSAAQAIVSQLHKAAFYVFLSHPIALFWAQENLPEGTPFVFRFLARAAAGFLLPFIGSLIYVWIKGMLMDKGKAIAKH